MPDGDRHQEQGSLTKRKKSHPPFGWDFYIPALCFLSSCDRMTEKNNMQEAEGDNTMLTNEDIWNIALQQSAYDMGCSPEDFLSEANVVVISGKHPLARKYLPLPLSCDLVSYGSNIVAQASPEIAPLVRQYIDRYPVEHCFETPNLHVLNDAFQEKGYRVCFMAEYFLPDVNNLNPLECPYEIKFMEKGLLNKAYRVL